MLRFVVVEEPGGLATPPAPVPVPVWAKAGAARSARTDAVARSLFMGISEEVNCPS
jgi:hypothetical protein